MSNNRTADGGSMKYLGLILLGLLVVSCSSKPIVPMGENVKVSRQAADKDCVDLGPVRGTVQGTKPNVEKAIENMKQEAANKGANYVKMETASDYGTAVRGTAYDCN
jgi:hypothetical protein